MRHAIKLILISVLAAHGAARAEIPPSMLFEGEEVAMFGYRFHDLQGDGSLTLSAELLGALNAAEIDAAAIAPGVLGNNGPTLSVGLDVAAVGIEVDTVSSTLTTPRTRTVGGVTMVAPTQNFATTGGSLTITNIKVDMLQRAIYADLVGGNGVGTVKNLYVWDFDTVTGETTKPLAPSYMTFQNTLSGLTLTENAFHFFAQSLGLSADGSHALRAVTDHGRLTTRVIFQVPEPSTYALMGLGLVGIALVAKRRGGAAISRI